MNTPPPPTASADPHLTAARLAAIVDSSEDAIISKNLAGVIESWNPGAERIFGYTADEMIGTSVLRLIPPDRQDEESQILERIRRGERVAHFHTQRLTQDGRSLDVSVTTSPIRDPSGRLVGVSTIGRDISALKAKEQEIARLNRLYAALSQVNQAIVMMPDRRELLERICQVLVEFGGFHLAWVGWQDPQTGRLNPVASGGADRDYLERIRIYTDNRPEGLGPAGAAFREDRPYICNDLLSDPAMAPWHAQLESRSLRSAGAFPVRCEGRVCGTLNVYAAEPNFFQEREVALLRETAGDLSFGLDNIVRRNESRRAEQTVRQERDFSDAIINSLPGVLYLYNRQGKFLRWNRNFERVTGYTADEIATLKPLDFFSGPDRALVAGRIEEVFAAGRSSVEAGLVAKDGRVTPYCFTGVVIQFRDQPCLVGVGIDLSALRRAENADQLKSAFLAAMSHELRTPLNSILGFTGILLQGLAGALNAEQGKQLGMVQGSARHLLELINDVLDLSKIEAGQLEVRPETFELAALLEQTAASVRPLAAKKGLGLRLSVDPALTTIYSDRRRVAQILLNLLQNAIKFTPAGGVSLSAEAVADLRLAPDAAIGPGVKIQVADTGIGISPEDFANLFQPFRQLDSGLARSHEGTGLGLAICRRLALLLGGDIFVASQPARGSVFTVALPLHQPPSP